MGQTELLNDLCGMAGVDDCDIQDDEMGNESMNMSPRVHAGNQDIHVNDKMINGGIQSTNTTSF